MRHFLFHTISCDFLLFGRTFLLFFGDCNKTDSLAADGNAMVANLESKRAALLYHDLYTRTLVLCGGPRQSPLAPLTHSFTSYPSLPPHVALFSFSRRDSFMRAGCGRGSWPASKDTFVHFNYWVQVFHAPSANPSQAGIESETK